MAIAWLCVLCGAIPAGVAWLLNNRRLGLVTPIATRVFLTASFVIYGVVMARLIMADDNAPLEGRLKVIGFVMTLIVSWQLYSSQQTPYARHRKTGGKTASLWGLVLMGLIGILLPLSLEVGGEILVSQSDYQEFDRVAASMTQNQSQSRKAEIFFKDFQRKYPEEPLAHWNLAVIYDRSDRIEQAKAELRKMLELEPENKDALDYFRQLEAS